MADKPKNTDSVFDLDNIDFDKSMEDLLSNDPNDGEEELDLELEDNKKETVEEGEEDKEESSEEETEDESDDEQSEDESEDESKEEPTVIQDVIKQLGIEIEGDLEDSVEGIVSLTKQASAQLAKQELDALFSELPDVQKYLQFRLNGGDADKFFTTHYKDDDYSSIELKEDDSILQERIVRQELVNRGLEKEDIEETIKDLSNSDLLYSQAQRSLKLLARDQKKSQEELFEQQDALAKQAAKEQLEYVAEVKTKIDKASDFKGIRVTETEKKELSQYVTSPVANGLSQFQIDMEQADTDTLLAIASLMRKKFNIEGLISNKAKTLKANQLRNRLKGSKKELRSETKKEFEMSKKPNLDNLEFVL